MNIYDRLKWLILIVTVHNGSTRPSGSPDEAIFRSTQVIRCLPQNRSQLLQLNSLKSNLNYDFWLNPRQVDMPVDIMAEGIYLMELKSTLEENGIPYVIFISDVHMAVQEHLMENERQLFGGDYFEAYHNYDEIIRWMKKLRDKHSNNVSLIRLGRSYEYRVMYVAKVTGKSNQRGIKPALWIDGGMHGREWISPAVVTYMLNELVTNQDYAALLDQVDFYFMPVMNPDGYDYTFTENGRLWRKTRSWRFVNRKCLGVDANRNWNFHWNETGEPCADNYPGNVPFSEKESIHTKKEMMNNILSLKGYLSYHSYAQLWLFPWGYTTEFVTDFIDLESLAGEAVDAIYNCSGTHYKQQQYCVDPSLCTYGNSIDYLKGVGKLKYTYLIQLPDLGNYGYLLPPSQIIPIGEESLRGLIVVANAVKTEP